MSNVVSASGSPNNKIITPLPALTPIILPSTVKPIQVTVQNQEIEKKSLTDGNSPTTPSASNTSLDHIIIAGAKVIQPPTKWNAALIAAQLWLLANTTISEETIKKVNFVQAYLDGKGYELKGAPADGDCFCHAFLGSHDLLPVDRRIPLLEEASNKISFLRGHISAQFKNSPQGSKNGTRVDELLKPGEWINSFEGGLLAVALRIPMRVLTVNYDPQSKNCGIDDTLTFPETNKPSQNWDMILPDAKPKNFIFIVDLGHHFIYASEPGLKLAKSIPAGIKNSTKEAPKIILPPSPPIVEAQPSKEIKSKKQASEKVSYSIQNLSPLPLSNEIALYPALDPTAKKITNAEFIQSIKGVIEDDPLFRSPVETGYALLEEIHEFLSTGGKPTVIIPEIRIGTVYLKKISCFELLYRIYHYDIKGLKVFWDHIKIGPEINQAFKLTILECLCVIDTLLEEHLSTTEEFVALVQCVQASDPYLSNAKDTGNRVLHLMEKFLQRNGDPLFYVSNLKMGREYFEKLAIYEWVSLLWKHPYEAELEDWDYEDSTIEELEDEDIPEDEPQTPPPNLQAFNNRFENIIDRFFLTIQQKLNSNQVKDEDFLTLIRCAVQFSEESEGDLISAEKTGQKFLCVMSYFVQRKINPNLQLSQIEINGNVYSQVTCLQVTYLVWRNPNAKWSSQQEEQFDQLINAMLSDPRTDLTLKFSERSLSAHHFVNRKNLNFYHQLYGVKKKGEKKKFYTTGNYKPSETAIDQLHGHSLERMTLAHYAVMVGDYPMLTRFLDLESRLLEMTCCITKGKASIVDPRRYIIYSQGKEVNLQELERNEQLSGTFSFQPRSERTHIQLVRATNVTLLHLAARVGKPEILSCLGSRHPNPSLTDSDHKTPQDYLKFSIIEGLVPNDPSSRMMFRSLDLVTRFHSTKALPEVHKLMHFDGYDVLVDTSRRVAIFVHQRLKKDSFGNASREGEKWVEESVLPMINRPADSDYVRTGYHRGHLAPAEDGTGSDEKMAATFHLVNAVPQNPNINTGAWARLEAHVRALAHQNDLVEVFSGPLFVPQGNISQYGVIGAREVHVPTHLFKVVYKHNRETTLEIYVFPNQTNTSKKHFSTFRNDASLEFIQHHSGILFSQWIRK